MEDGSWRTLGREYLYRNPWCAFRVDEVELPGGAQIEYGVLESGGFAAVVPVTDGGDVVLVRQWRQPLGAFTLELPSGGVDAGEDPCGPPGGSSSRRRATGPRGWSISPPSTPARGGARRSATFSGAGRCGTRGPRPEPTEFIKVVELPLGEALQMVSEVGSPTRPRF